MTQVSTMTAGASVSTLVGTGVPGRAPDGAIGPATPAAEPFGVALDPDGRLCFCDLGNPPYLPGGPARRPYRDHRRHGPPRHSGDGGPALEADVREPYEIRFDADGNLYFVDMPSHVVRRVASDGSRIDHYRRDRRGRLPRRRRSRHRGRVPATAQHRNRTRRRPVRGRHRQPPDTAHRSRHGTVETFAGTGEPAPATDGGAIGRTPLHGPRTLAFDETGDLYLTLREGNAVYRIDMRNRTLHHVAGTGKGGYRGDGGDVKTADLAGPRASR